MVIFLAGFMVPEPAEIPVAIGDIGNAKGKTSHLHHSILSFLPLPWLADTSTQGYKKAFYLIRYLVFQDIGSSLSNRHHRLDVDQRCRLLFLSIYLLV